MKRKEINVPLKLKEELIPETLKERLVYFFFEQRFLWETLEDIEYTLQNGDKVIVPKGFVCDLCSVPHFLHWAISPYSTTVKAYILHDWMYKTDFRRGELGDDIGRLYADEEMLYQADLLDKDKESQNRLLYRTVRLFGKKVYERYENDT